jgi:hypothetical protein
VLDAAGKLGEPWCPAAEATATKAQSPPALAGVKSAQAEFVPSLQRIPSPDGAEDEFVNSIPTAGGEGVFCGGMHSKPD